VSSSVNSSEKSSYFLTRYVKSVRKLLTNQFISSIGVKGFLSLNLKIGRIFKIISINIACKMSLSYLLKYFASMLFLSRSSFRCWVYICRMRILSSVVRRLVLGVGGYYARVPCVKNSLIMLEVGIYDITLHPTALLTRLNMKIVKIDASALKDDEIDKKNSSWI